MKLTNLLFLVTVFNVFGSTTFYGQNTINLDMKGVPIKEVLSAIENQSDFYFLYSSKMVDVTSTVDVSADNKNVTEVLSNLFRGTDIAYDIRDKHILLSDKKATTPMPTALQQSRTISGRVISSEDGLGMPGVPVVVKGTTIGTATDINGNFTLNVPNDATIVVSFMGFRTQEQAVGNLTQFNFTLQPDVLTLGDVVVTALGIQREAKTLTYSAQQVSGAEMMRAQDMNFMNALSGRAAGLEVRSAGSGAGGSTRTVLRGAKSFSSVGNPLYVIDGAPMVNRVSSGTGMYGGTDQGDGLSQLNPDDIESITVLKGANAAMLYGSAGANGVILITTKRGQEGSVNVSISNATSFESVLLWPDLQYKYGAAGPSYNAKESWGLEPLTKPGFTEKDLKDFYNTGYNTASNISISAGTRNTTVYFSYGNTLANGVIPEQRYRRDNVSLRQSTKIFNDKVTISTNVMFSDEMRYNTPQSGWYLNPNSSLAWFPRNRDIRAYRDEILNDEGRPVMGNDGVVDLQHSWRRWNDARQMYNMNWFVVDHFQNNPWWLRKMQLNWIGGRRVIAGATITYDITNNLKFTAKGNYDYANRRREWRHWAGSNTTNVSQNGTWDFSQFVDRMQYFDAILSYNKNFGDFSLTAIAGISYQETDYGVGVSVGNGTTNLKLPNEFMFQNIPESVMISTSAGSQTIKEGYFANASLGFREMIFLELSGRQDRSSTMALTDFGVGYFYPAVGLSGIVSQMVTLPSFITFGKVRGSYTVVANDLGFDNVIQRSSMNSTGGVGTPTVPDWTEGRPEKIASIEFGTDWRFLEGRVGFDFSYYDITSTDQRISVAAPRGNGFRNKTINTGKIVNRGVEIMVDAEPVSTGDFSWNTSLNFAHNKNIIVEVLAGNPDYVISSISSAWVTRTKNGGSIGDVYAWVFVHDEQGRTKLDRNYVPIKSKDFEYIGSANPDFSLGWNNSFRYKNWSMGFLINGVFGGKVASYTEAFYDIYGVSKRSADYRDNGMEVNAIVDAPATATAAAAPNHGQEVTRLEGAQIEGWYNAVGGINGIFGNYFYDRTNIRLTQFSLSYNVPVRQLNLPFKSASVGLIGQNLLFLYRKAPYDPEITFNSTSVGQNGVDNFGQLPTRTYGFNIKINF